ncbi:helix-turn-helix transcriptional regulator [Methylobacterium sp. SD274]|uniref:ArsR/SmtB family transcription factor n=1 Tax=Methylobacterium sp. SD274 TaxID=2782009 RepID=UPI001A965CD6|nr:helix-turn-helix transcriptional regulator [Methylobacterium sp. SD274]MBO1021598.1 helix-turn-helix transcriptional regulator [Methylobacterium sp. SD274]
MQDGPVIAAVAALLGDPARANMLTALMDGRALTVSELSEVAGIALPTASGHLAKLEAAALLTVERQGRHRYYRLSGSDVAVVLEHLMGLAQRTGAVRTRTGPRDAALREARICYDHLAGERGVLLLQGLIARGWIDEAETNLTASGRAGLTDRGLDVASLERGRRPVCRYCLDWSERRNHLGGALGAALLHHVLDRAWASRAGGRVIAFTTDGSRALSAAFGPPA